jgi:uncharacterized protein
MKLSSYAMVYTSPRHEGYQLLFSTLFCSTVLLDEETFDRIGRDELSDEEAAELWEAGLIVEDPELERGQVMRLLERKNHLDTRFDLTVVMNLDCNLACVYCYEGDLKGRHYMSRETAEGIAPFLERTVPQQVERLDMTFYGGEPLLSRDLVKHIASRVGAAARGQGREFSFGFVTNGTLLTPAVVEELLPLGLTSAKVTLDGPERHHDMTRPFRGGGGSFAPIVNNIDRVAGLINISIGGNFTKDNYRAFPELLDQLIEGGLGPDRIASVKFDPVVQGDNWNVPRDFSDVGIIENEPWLVEASIYLRGEIIRRGFATPELSFFTCAVELRNSLVVNYDGTLYKCPGMLGKEGYKIGTLEDGVQDYSEAYNLDLWKTETCRACQYLPLCFGGCRYMSMIKDGKISEVDCRKEFFEETLREWVLQDISRMEEQA